MRPRFLFLSLLLALLALGLVPNGASAADPGFTTKNLSFDTVVGPNNDIHCNVDAVLYSPTGASRANPVPSILATNGFGGSKDEFSSIGPAYAKRGYAFLAYSGLGFGASGCKIELDDPDYDGKAGSQLVSFLGGSKAAKDGTRIDYVIHDATAHDGSHRSDDPRVGMIGGSYGGEIQFSVAGQDPRMDALVPQITWNDLSYSLAPNNTDFAHGVTYNTPGVLKVDWPTLFFGVGLGDGLMEAIQHQDASHVGQCPNFDDRTCQSLATGAATGFPDASTLGLLRHASVFSYINRIRIPTFLAQGEHDTLFNEQEATANYEALRAQGTPVKMLWRSSGHSGGSIGNSENDQSDPEKGYESRMELEWFDYYLRGIGDPPALSFSFFQDYIPYKGDAGPSVGSTPSYPAATNRTLYLSGANALVDSPAQIAGGSAAMAAVPAAPTSTGGGVVEALGSTDPPGTSVSFTGAPLTADTSVVGIPGLTVKVDAPTFAQSEVFNPGGHLVLFAKLYDVDPAGNGTAVLPNNLVSATRVADVTQPVAIQLPGIAHRFARGHELRVTLATSDATYKGNDVPGPVTVTVDPRSPSTLTVPILGAMAGPLGSGLSGTTPYTPAAQQAPVQPAGLGGPPPAPSAAALPSVACQSRRSFRIRLHRVGRHDRIVSAVVTVDGRRVKVLHGRRLRAAINLRGLPRGTFRVMVTVHTARGHVRQSARTYHTCVAGGTSRASAHRSPRHHRTARHRARRA